MRIQPRAESQQWRRQERLLKSIEEHPGAHLRQLHRLTGIPLGSTARGLDRLEEMGHISSEEHDAYRRYFPPDGIHRRERTVLAHVATTKARRILETILEQPGINHKDLHEAVGIPGPTLSYYVARLERDEVIMARERKTRRYFRIKNEELVRRALARWPTHDPALDD